MMARLICRAAVVAAFITSVSAGTQQAPEAAPGIERPSDAAPDAGPRRGAPVDLSGFRHRRAIQDARPGLVALQLDAAVLAESRGPDSRFADVRVVNALGYQIPYVLQRRPEPLTLSLPIEAATPQAPGLARELSGSRSHYAVTLPYRNLPRLRLVLDTSDRVFRRTVQAGVERPPDRRRRDAWFDVLASGVWQHADETGPAPPLALTVTPGDATALMLIVDEGDNRPLPITAARAHLPSWQLRFFKPAAPLELVYGRDDLAAPEYDLALLLPEVLKADARLVEAAPPASHVPADEPLLPAWLFWAGLVLAAVVLLALIVRLVSPAAGATPDR